MNTLLAYFSRRPRIKLLVIGYLSVVVIFSLDYVTGEKFSFSIFPIWNPAVMLGIFLLFTFLLVTLKKTLGQEKELARQIQQRLLPKAIPQIHGYEISTAWQPADTVAGDYFDVLPLDDRALSLCIADASGHGMPAALLMSNLQAGVRLLAAPNLAPHELCEKLNQLVCRNVTKGYFITFFYGLLDEARNKLIYTNAGHNPPILVHANDSTVGLDKGGIPLGVITKQQYQQAEVDLIPGSRLVLFTDGLVECRNLKDEAFGEKNLLALLSAHSKLNAAGLQKRVMATIAEFCREIYLDDVTLVVLAVA